MSSARSRRSCLAKRAIPNIYDMLPVVGESARMIADGDFLLPFLLNWVNIPMPCNNETHNMYVQYIAVYAHTTPSTQFGIVIMFVLVFVCVVAFVIRSWSVWLVVGYSIVCGSGIAPAKSLHLGLSS